jgi:hypothetical protein
VEALARETVAAAYPITWRLPFLACAAALTSGSDGLLLCAAACFRNSSECELHGQLLSLALQACQPALPSRQ